MPLNVLTDHLAIRAVLDRFVTRDAVRATLLGTIALTLEGSAWAAVGDEQVAVRSSASYPVVLAGPWPAADREELAGLLRGLPDLSGLSGVADVVPPLVTSLRGADGGGHRLDERLFRLDELIAPVGVPGRGAPADATWRTLARRWVAAFSAEAHGFDRSTDAIADRALDGGGLWLWLDRDATPVAMAVRRPVVSGSARIGPVYTPPEHRGRGYGSAVTSAATRSILDEGGIPVLFTDLANPTSNKIYQLLGYRPVEDRVVVTFSG